MIRKTIAIFIATILLFSLASCKNEEKSRYEGEFLVLFDTATRIIGYAYSEEEFGDYVEQIYDELEIYHQLYDIYNDYEGINNIKTINDNAGIEPVVVDKRVIDLLEFGKEVCDFSNGEVNIAMGAVLRIWHDYREAGTENPEEAAIPPMDLLEDATAHIDINKLIIDKEKSTVFLADPKMSLDVGGIAKGYAVERVSQYIINRGFTDGLISVGGNVRSFGYKGKEKMLWNIGIQNPEAGGEDIYTVSITDRSLVTSGDYIRYYTVGDKKYHHIIDSKTLMPSDYFTAVTIICEDSGMADALSTMIYNIPFEEGLEYIENLSETEAVWIFKDGSKRYSSGFEALMI